MVAAAEGNPDEEKIGAFGVGEQYQLDQSPLFRGPHDRVRFLQLVLSHGGTLCHLWRFVNHPMPIYVPH